MGDDLVIYYNDSIDSDNLAAAMALFNATSWKPTVRVLWILEPRQVCFGLSMTMDQINRCKELIKKHFPSVENPFKTLLNGHIKQQDIDDIKDLTKDDRSILEMAVKPEYGSINDAALHARLSALDLAACLSEWSNNNPIEVLVDYETLEHIENPVNLHMHHHEELVNRTENELKNYYDILENVLHFGRRTDNLRGWYHKCIWRLEKDMKLSDISVDRLVLDKVLHRIQTAGSVRFFGGSSLRILQQFLDRGVASKIKCHLQVGSCDMSANLFSNQFNIALNQQAAKIVLSRSTEFAEFTVVPSHTAQSIKYLAIGLKKFGGHCIEKRILGFNCHEEPLKIVTNQVSLEQQYPDKSYSMPDLTSFLCALVPGHMDSKPGYIEVDEQEGGTLLFKKSDKGILQLSIDRSFIIANQPQDGTLPCGVVASLASPLSKLTISTKPQQLRLSNLPLKESTFPAELVPNGLSKDMSANYWHSTQCRFWSFTKEQLATMRQKLEEDNAELVRMFPLPQQRHLYIYFNQQLIRLAKRLTIRQQSMATAQVYMKRFYTKVEIRRTNPYLVIATAIYLACKIEESPQHIRLIVTEARQMWGDLVAIDTSKLGECEFFMISEMRSQLIVFQPYRTITALRSELSLQDDEVQLARSVINDHFMTDLPLLYPPHIIAMVAILLALVLRPNNSGPGQNTSGAAAAAGLAAAQQALMRAQGQQAQGGMPEPAGAEPKEKRQQDRVSRVQKFAKWLVDSNVEIASMVDATQEIISFYECYEHYNDKLTREQINRFVKARGLDK
ncbi:hypothetical protein FGADI_533 [Fusarium gaditjirri]|uniref:RNA polymerase II holoenzyme cyclin-like subunit n=1 Tax=Fusarium gaditjirri TaxID=282569 RepID=A0A8H4TN18_9HYPO|nr:hypothetical protein FGADI_533 [Fusarium gaditjirri]